MSCILRAGWLSSIQPSAPTLTLQLVWALSFPLTLSSPLYPSLQRPYLYTQGRVVGVNTAIFTNTGTSAGVGFAIPIDIVKSIVPQLIQFGKVVRPALNIQVTYRHVVLTKLACQTFMYAFSDNSIHEVQLWLPCSMPT